MLLHDSRRAARTSPEGDLILLEEKSAAMLARLASGEATVTELAAPFDKSLPAISKHLRVLRQAGLVEHRFEQLERLVIPPHEDPCLGGLVGAYRRRAPLGHGP